KASQSRAWGSCKRSESASNQNLPIGLQSDCSDDVVRTAARSELHVQTAVHIDPSDSDPRLAVVEPKISADDDFAIGLKRERIDTSAQDSRTGIEAGIDSAAAGELRNPTQSRLVIRIKVATHYYRPIRPQSQSED